jgi:hypothetical protein
MSDGASDNFLKLEFVADTSAVRKDLENIERTPVKVRVESQGTPAAATSRTGIRETPEELVAQARDMLRTGNREGLPGRHPPVHLRVPDRRRQPPRDACGRGERARRAAGAAGRAV